MKNRFRKTVEEQLVPRIAQLQFEVVESEQSPDFDTAAVILKSGAVRLRIEKQRWEHFAYLGSTADPSKWFGLGLILDYLREDRQKAFPDARLETLLAFLPGFLAEHWTKLRSRLEPASFADFENELQALNQRLVREQFGYSPPDGP